MAEILMECGSLGPLPDNAELKLKLIENDFFVMRVQGGGYDRLACAAYLRFNSGDFVLFLIKLICLILRYFSLTSLVVDRNINPSNPTRLEIFLLLSMSQSTCPD